jgi:molybdopterin adenylyltransferase
MRNLIDAWSRGLEVSRSRGVYTARLRIRETAQLQYPAMIRARVITCSDAASRGQRDDRSGPAVREILQRDGYEVDAVVIVPDEIEAIVTAIENATGDGARLVVTTGGTGVAPRDVTPEATARVCDRVIPGFGELMRSQSLKKTPMASLSRAQAATRGSALIVNLPGSVNGACENLNAVLKLIPHALELLSGKRVDHD